MKQLTIFVACSAIYAFALAAYADDKEKSIPGSLTLSNLACISSVLPDFNVVDSKMMTKLEKDKEILEKENNFIAYYGADTKLTLTAVDDEDEITVGDNGTVIVDDNRAQSSSVVLEIPVSKLFGRKNHKEIKTYELEKNHNSSVREFHSSLLEKYLNFKDGAEKLKKDTSNGAITYTGSHKHITELRKSAMIYFSHSDPVNDCVTAWLLSEFEPS